MPRPIPTRLILDQVADRTIDVPLISFTGEDVLGDARIIRSVRPTRMIHPGKTEIDQGRFEPDKTRVGGVRRVFCRHGFDDGPEEDLSFV